MTEDDWLHGANSADMLRYLQGKVSVRKYLLTRCAFLRCFWSLLTDVRTRRVVEAAEKYADGLISLQSFCRSRASAQRAHTRALQKMQARGGMYNQLLGMRLAAWEEETLPQHRMSAARPRKLDMLALFYTLVVGCSLPYPSILVNRPSGEPRPAPPPRLEPGTPEWDDLARKAHEGAEMTKRHMAWQAGLLRDLFGNPFRPSTITPTVRAWNGGLLVRLAAAMYRERTFDAMPVLGDALEEAGCADPDILGHCRGVGPHALGCWVVDRLLEKD